MTTRPLTYQEFLNYSREQARVLDVERKRIAALEAEIRVLVALVEAHVGTTAELAAATLPKRAA